MILKITGVTVLYGTLLFVVLPMLGSLIQVVLPWPL